MKFCDQPWTTFTVEADGSVVPCMCRAWHNIGSIGNLLENEFNEIINSSKLIDFRKSILDQTFKHCTKICPYLPVLPDSTRKDISEIILPKHLLLSIDMNCNLRCESCRSLNVFSKSRNKIADIILDKIKKTFCGKQVTIQCDGSGDVFASESYKNFFREIDINFKLQIITNGNLITNNQDILQRLSNQIISVDISLDAATPETYTKTRGGMFKRVLDGIKILIDKNIKTNLSFVVQKKNYTEVKSAYELGVELGCHSINFHKILRWPHMTDLWWNANRLEDNPGVDLIELKKNLNFFKQLPKHIVYGKSIPVYMTGDLFKL
jgi:radical SAM protein with 4Fe4S-binding SPASM domain